MIVHWKFLPGTGRGTMWNMVEGSLVMFLRSGGPPVTTIEHRRYKNKKDRS